MCSDRKEWMNVKPEPPRKEPVDWEMVLLSATTIVSFGLVVFIVSCIVSLAFSLTKF